MNVWLLVMGFVSAVFAIIVFAMYIRWNDKVLGEEMNYDNPNWKVMPLYYAFGSFFFCMAVIVLTHLWLACWFDIFSLDVWEFLKGSAFN